MSSTEQNTAPKLSLWSKDALTWVGVSVIAIGIAIAGGAYWDSVVTVQQVRFEGNYFVSEEKLADVDVPLGVNPDSVDFMKLKKEYERILYVDQASINVEPNGNLVIEIREREPIALLVDKPWRYIDASGLVLPYLSDKKVDVPILYGFEALEGDTVTSKEYQITAEFLSNLKRAPVTDATLGEVAWTDNEGVVAVTNDHGVKITFGKDHFPTRIRHWEAFYKEIIKQKGMAAMNSIDLRFDGQIVTRENS